MAEGLLDCDSLRRVEREQLLDKIQEVTVDGIAGRNDLLGNLVRSLTDRWSGITHLQTPACSYLLLALARSLRLWPIEFAPLFEVFWLSSCTGPREPLWHLAHDLFHHGQVL